jgi:hypothetical protein
MKAHEVVKRAQGPQAGIPGDGGGVPVLDVAGGDGKPLEAMVQAIALGEGVA